MKVRGLNVGIARERLMQGFCRRQALDAELCKGALAFRGMLLQYRRVRLLPRLDAADAGTQQHPNPRNANQITPDPSRNDHVLHSAGPDLTAGSRQLQNSTFRPN